MLHRHGAHAEAVARIGWCIAARALGELTGEVGAGKGGPPRRLAAVDLARHHHLHGNRAVGGRGL
jgi:hypothetical protein